MVRVRGKREAKQLLHKALDSLALSIELFNRPHDAGRSTAVMILLDHAFEMLLKASILHRGGVIRDKGSRNTIGFSTCVNRARSDGTLKFVSDDESRTINVINAVRDAAQHHLIDLSEEQLYFHVQTGVTIFRDIVLRVFSVDVGAVLPRRVLPISTVSFTSVEVFFDSKVEEIKKLLTPGKRRRAEAVAVLRPIAILDRALREEEGQPSERDLDKMISALRASTEWRHIFRDVALIEAMPMADGPRINLRMTKREGAPVHIATDNDDLPGVMVTRTVDLLSVFSLTPTTMAKHLKITVPRFVALSRSLDLESNTELFQLVKVGKQSHKRYSQAGLSHAKQECEKLSPEQWDEIWACFAPVRRSGKTRGEA